jgi:hypothetical protein
MHKINTPLAVEKPLFMDNSLEERPINVTKNKNPPINGTKVRIYKKAVPP